MKMANKKNESKGAYSPLLFLVLGVGGAGLLALLLGGKKCPSCNVGSLTSSSNNIYKPSTGTTYSTSSKINRACSSCKEY